MSRMKVRIGRTVRGSSGLLVTGYLLLAGGPPNRLPTASNKYQVTSNTSGFRLHIQHPQHHQVLDVDQSDRPVLVVHDGEVVDPQRPHDGDGLAGEAVAVDALRVVRHH